MSVAEHVPSPADASRPTAEELLASFADEGARIFRMTAGPRVFVLTNDQQVANRIMDLGGRPFLPVHLKEDSLLPTNGYRRIRGDDSSWEWDIEIAGIPVSGEETLWEAAGAYRRGKRE